MGNAFFTNDGYFEETIDRTPKSSSVTTPKKTFNFVNKFMDIRCDIIKEDLCIMIFRQKSGACA